MSNYRLTSKDGSVYMEFDVYSPTEISLMWAITRSEAQRTKQTLVLEHLFSDKIWEVTA